MVIWNHPSTVCDSHGVNLNLSAWDIVENKGDEFAGEMIKLFYHMGEWPALFQNGSVRQNGGVPQVSINTVFIIC
jgi:hypothetical protein